MSHTGSGNRGGEFNVSLFEPEDRGALGNRKDSTLTSASAVWGASGSHHRKGSLRVFSCLSCMATAALEAWERGMGGAGGRGETDKKRWPQTPGLSYAELNLREKEATGEECPRPPPEWSQTSQKANQGLAASWKEQRGRWVDAAEGGRETTRPRW